MTVYWILKRMQFAVKFYARWLKKYFSFSFFQILLPIEPSISCSLGTSPSSSSRYLRKSFYSWPQLDSTVINAEWTIDFRSFRYEPPPQHNTRVTLKKRRGKCVRKAVLHHRNTCFPSKIFFLLFFEEKFKGPNSFAIFFLKRVETHTIYWLKREKMKL